MQMKSIFVLQLETHRVGHHELTDSLICIYTCHNASLLSLSYFQNTIRITNMSITFYAVTSRFVNDQ